MFEYFENVGVRVTESRVSLNKYCIFSFNKGAVKSLNLEKYKFVRLLFDKKVLRIGFEFTNDNSKPHYNIRKTKLSGFYVSARSFFKNYGINPTSTVSHKLDKFRLSNGTSIVFMELRNEPKTKT